jgi:hypothetical protein
MQDNAYNESFNLIEEILLEQKRQGGSAKFSPLLYRAKDNHRR